MRPAPRRVAALWGLVSMLCPLAPAAAQELACVLKPSRVVVVGSAVGGVLEQLVVEPGQWVSAGDVIAQLDSKVERADVALAKAKVESTAALQSADVKLQYSGRKANRARELRARAAIADHEVDEAEGEEALAKVQKTEALESKRIAEAELQRAQAALELRTIRSPIAGVVVQRYLFSGELVREGPLVKIAQVDPLSADLYAPTSWLGRVADGTSAQVKLDGPVGGTYTGHVTFISPVVETASGTVNIKLELPNPNRKIPAGLPCKVRFR